MISPPHDLLSHSDQIYHTTFAGDFDQTHLPSGWNVRSKSLNNTEGHYAPSEQGQHTSADLHPYTTAAGPPTHEHTNMPTGTSRSITSPTTSTSTISPSTTSTSTTSTSTAATPTIANVDMAQLAQIDIGQSSMEVHKQNIAVLFGTILSGAAAFCGIIFLHRWCYRKFQRPRRDRVDRKKARTLPDHSPHDNELREISRFSEYS
ncbi:hypothetical protein N7470_000615 [Penicillium chermesinum]|nr:hypothetical protein N7470_000615 [Penicillium chermesinum]